MSTYKNRVFLGLAVYFVGTLVFLFSNLRASPPTTKETLVPARESHTVMLPAAEAREVLPVKIALKHSQASENHSAANDNR